MLQLRSCSLLLLVLVLAQSAAGLENGLSRTPPMGWLAWERFRCNTDCVNDPYNCISESLFMQMADIIVAEGYLDAGYSMVSLDDCWLARDRDARHRLQPDFTRFPSGIPALSNYMHARGLSFGIYEDYGNYTCAGYPGILGYLEIDAQTFADWEVDYVKLDGCYSHPADMDRGYPEFGYFLNKTGRPMQYSCSWPFYQIYSGMQPNWTSIIGTCNLWRNFDDIQDSWDSVQRIIDYYGDNQDDIVPNAGPGHWNDPDMPVRHAITSKSTTDGRASQRNSSLVRTPMQSPLTSRQLIIGNFGLSYEQSKSQMALWAIFAAPLLMSVDLRTIKPDYKAILLNKGVIAVNQDPLGIQGRRIYKDKGIEIWARPISPVYQDFYSYAIAFLNRRTDGTPSEVSVTLSELGLTYKGGYTITDLFDGVNYGVVEPEKRFKVDVNPSGVVLVRCDVAANVRRRTNNNAIGNFHNNNAFGGGAFNGFSRSSPPPVTHRVNPLTNELLFPQHPGPVFRG